ncbi:serine hydrolase [Glycomyces tarimensis]
MAGTATFSAVSANEAKAALDDWFGPSKDKLDAELRTRIDDYLADSGTQVEASVAVGRGDLALEYNGDQTHITASIVKIEILAMIQQYWGAVEEIPDDHLELMRLMITESDNDSTTELFNFLGGKEALEAANERYGLENTTADPDGRWGLAETIASDQLILADINLFEGVLDAGQVELGRELLGGVIEAQAWGVSAAAETGEAVWLKNGWDVESQLGGLWVVNSVGVLGGDGDDPVKMAILTSGAADASQGIPIVEDIARIAREVIERS